MFMDRVIFDELHIVRFGVPHSRCHFRFGRKATNLKVGFFLHQSSVIESLHLTLAFIIIPDFVLTGFSFEKIQNRFLNLLT